MIYVVLWEICFSCIKFGLVPIITRAYFSQLKCVHLLRSFTLGLSIAGFWHVDSLGAASEHWATGGAYVNVICDITSSRIGALARLKKKNASSVVQTGIYVDGCGKGSGMSRPRLDMSSVFNEGICEASRSLAKKSKDVSRADDSKRGKNLVFEITSATEGEVMSDICRFAESHVGDLDSRIRALLQQVEGGQEEVKALRASIKEKDVQLAEMKKALAERTALWDNEKKTLEDELDNSLTHGFGLCWNMASATGVDMSAFTLANYLKSLDENGGSDSSHRA
ncbi:hypothetical protein AgCh_013239 [Apium graveolens]